MDLRAFMLVSATSSLSTNPLGVQSNTAMSVMIFDTHRWPVRGNVQPVHGLCKLPDAFHAISKGY